MKDRPDDTPSDGGGAATSDLFFGLAGILIVLICLASGPLRQAVAARDLPATITAPGQWLAVADAQGLVLTRPGAAPLRLPLDAITPDALAPWAQEADVPLVVLTPDAQDSAFLLDSALATASVPLVRRVRLERACPHPRVTAQGVVCGG